MLELSFYVVANALSAPNTLLEVAPANLVIVPVITGESQ
jgi:hypothetical protein